MISVQNISYHAGAKVLLDNVSVKFEPRKLNLIIGPNGAGKSTLVKIISGKLKPSAGSVLYSEKKITAYALADLAKIRAVLSQSIEVSFPLKVKEVVMMGRYPHFTGKPDPPDFEAAEEAMDLFSVTALAERNFLTLSGGEKQRVHFARVLSQIWTSGGDEHKYLIMDEPLTFLDVKHQFDFMRKIIDLLKNKNLTVVGVVHDLNLAARFADQVVLLHEGKLIDAGSAEQVLSPKNIEKAYQLNASVVKQEGELYIHFK
jgi:iron complex transport system ATP-binding protein